MAEGPAGAGAATLAPLWLEAVSSTSTREAVLALVDCPAPPGRDDLQPEIINMSIRNLEDGLSRADRSFQRKAVPDVSHEDAMVLGIYTMEDPPVYKFLNGWGNHRGRRPVDLGPHVARLFRRLTEAMNRLPPKFLYTGYGVRVVHLRTEVLQTAYREYKTHFEVGKPVNWHTFASFSINEDFLSNFLTDDKEQVIQFVCAHLIGWHMDEFSMMIREGNPSEKEVLVPAPSFFRVSMPPVKLRNAVIVYIDYDATESFDRRYLSAPDEAIFGQAVRRLQETPVNRRIAKLEAQLLSAQVATAAEVRRRSRPTCTIFGFVLLLGILTCLWPFKVPTTTGPLDQEASSGRCAALNITAEAAARGEAEAAKAAEARAKAEADAANAAKAKAMAEAESMKAERKAQAQTAKAVGWYQRAAEQGHPEAKDDLARLRA